MKPTVGRTVWYYQNLKSKIPNVGIVCYVREDSTLTLACFDSIGTYYTVEGVPFAAINPPNGRYCTWPDEHPPEDPVKEESEGVMRKKFSDLDGVEMKKVFDEAFDIPIGTDLPPTGLDLTHIGPGTVNPMIGPGLVKPDTKQERYKGKSGEDLIDRWAREDTPDVFRVKVMAQIERYASRYGKKDVTLQEAVKIQDYATRLVEYETKLL